MLPALRNPPPPPFQPAGPPASGSEASDPRTWYILGGIVLAGAVVGGVVYAVGRRQVPQAGQTGNGGPLLPPPPGPGDPGGPPDPGAQDGEGQDGEAGETGGGNHGGIEDLSPREQADLRYQQNKFRIDRSILRQLDRAAAQKGVEGGWVGEVTGGPQILQATMANPQPAKGPNVWSQPEAWWVSTETVKEVFGEDQLEDIQAWGQALTPLNASGAMGPDAPRAFLKGKIMRMVMELTGAQPEQAGAMQPDWSMF